MTLIQLIVLVSFIAIGIAVSKLFGDDVGWVGAFIGVVAGLLVPYYWIRYSSKRNCPTHKANERDQQDEEKPST